MLTTATTCCVAVSYRKSHERATIVLWLPLITFELIFRSHLNFIFKVFFYHFIFILFYVSLIQYNCAWYNGASLPGPQLFGFQQTSWKKKLDILPTCACLSEPPLGLDWMACHALELKLKFKKNRGTNRLHSGSHLGLRSSSSMASTAHSLNLVTITSLCV